MLKFKEFFKEQLETEETIIVIFPGRFQPFHTGHKKLYEIAKIEFPNAEFYITTADPTEKQISQEPERYPFNFEEKKKIIEATGVPYSEIIQANTPYTPKDLLSKYNPEKDKLIILVGEKDMKENPRFKFTHLKSGAKSYFQPFHSIEDMKPFKEKEGHGYVYAPSTITFEVNGQIIKSASELRNMFVEGDSEEQKEIVKSLIGRYDPEIHKILLAKLIKIDK